MEVEFLNKKLEQLVGEGASIAWLPVNVIKSARRKIILLAAASDERDLRNWKSLHYEKLIGDKNGLKSIRINKKWRIVFKLDTNVNPPKIKIISIEDYHD